MKILILIHSVYGHIYHMAQAVAEGVREVDGIEVEIKRVEEVLDAKILDKIPAQKEIQQLPLATLADLESADGIIFGTGTRFGNMSSQMKSFIDKSGGLWAKGALMGKVGSVFTSTGTQHGGQETTIVSFHFVMMHHGMVVVGLPYSFKGQSTIQEISGGSPYGASTITGPDGSRQPSENELAGARYQGRHVAQIVKKLSA